MCLGALGSPSGYRSRRERSPKGNYWYSPFVTRRDKFQRGRTICPPIPDVSGSAVSSSIVYTGCSDVFKKGRLEVLAVGGRYDSNVFGSSTTFVPGSMELGYVAAASPSAPMVTKLGIMNPL